ncbi:MAG: peptidoglycan-binding protein [Oscillospiraceae bacterium]|jgi:hypothetical protein|nr:peptidoglycan-binding protein [Oscillospiraceae bacterium]
MKILVYNNRTGQMETYFKELNEPMPYADSSLLVDEFRGSSQSQIMWTTKDAMESWVKFRHNVWGQPIYLPYAYRRIGEGGHAGQSQHYAGTSFDCAQNLSSTQRNRLRQAAETSGLWVYVEPSYLTPTWVHMDKRVNPPACSTGGYPVQKLGSRNNYVCILQDALNTVLGRRNTVDGIYGENTARAVMDYQASRKLTADGIVGCNTWLKLTGEARGAGRIDY